MRRGRSLWLVAAALLAALGIVLAVLALDASRWHGRLEREDARFAGTPGLAEWEPDSVLPGGLVRRATGVDDDLELREALRLFRLSRPERPIRELADVARRSAAETALARVGRRERDPRRRSLVATLRGVLAIEEARFDQAQQGVLLRRSLAELREAVTLDPGNADAKHDLEIVLQLLRQAQSQDGGGSAAERGDVQATGAGAASTGGGY